MKLLWVEDDRLTRSVLAQLLSKAGYAVIEADNGQVALDIWNAQTDITLVVSDWMMPRMDGAELLQRIRRVSNRPYTCFIFLTAKRDAASTLAALKMGADDYMTKPVDADELKARLQIAQRTLEREDQLTQALTRCAELEAEIARRS